MEICNVTLPKVIKKKNNPLISIIVPVKRVDTRPKMLETCVSSIFTNAEDPYGIELFIGLDEFDEVTLKYVRESIPEHIRKYHIVVFWRPPSDNFIQNFYESGYRMSKGDLIWCLGEDVEILTKNYDTIIKKRIQDRGEKCVMPYIIVGGRFINGLPDGRNQYCNFPLISRNFKHHDTFLPTTIPSWGVDAYFDGVFKWIAFIGKNQTLDLREEIKLHHRSHHFGDFEKDELYELQEKRGNGQEEIAVSVEMHKTISYFYNLFFTGQQPPTTTRYSILTTESPQGIGLCNIPQFSLTDENKKYVHEVDPSSGMAIS